MSKYELDLILLLLLLIFNWNQVLADSDINFLQNSLLITVLKCGYNVIDAGIWGSDLLFSYNRLLLAAYCSSFTTVSAQLFLIPKNESFGIKLW